MITRPYKLQCQTRTEQLITDRSIQVWLPQQGEDAIWLFQEIKPARTGTPEIRSCVLPFLGAFAKFISDSNDHLKNCHKAGVCTTLWVSHCPGWQLHGRKANVSATCFTQWNHTFLFLKVLAQIMSALLSMPFTLLFHIFVSSVPKFLPIWAAPIYLFDSLKNKKT